MKGKGKGDVVMHIPRISVRRSISGLSVVLGLLLVAPAFAVDLEQVIVLQPGWNAVFLEVEPQPTAPDSVFQGLPVASVWRWNPEGNRVDFLQDPAEGLVSQPGFLGYFPPHRPESILTNVYAIEANTAYLINLEGTVPVTWTLRGRPSLEPTPWIADSFNLRGFHVNGSAAPAFGDYFEASTAHAGQPVYRLTAAGVWGLVTAQYSTPIRSGEAYWVYCEGPSDYRGPIEIDTEDGDAVEFGGGLNTARIFLKNRSTVPAVVSIRYLSGNPRVPLQYKNVDPVSAEMSWPDIPGALQVGVEGESEAFVDFAVRRSDFEGRRESILELVDSLGTRRRVFVGASTAFEAPPASEAKSRRFGLSATKATTNPLGGLWVGEVTVNAVSESQVGSLEAVPTGSSLNFRVLIHVDSIGQANLLKDVIQLFEEGTLAPDPDDPSVLVEDVPGRYVLITDESLIPNYTGANLRDGTPVGVRVSTAAYDFPEDSVELTGSFGTGRLSATLTLEPESPTNPFRHKYHPDHDNLDLQFVGFLEEAFTVIRDMEFEFTSEDPEGKNLRPGWGDTEVGGIFRETISGLHKNDIAVEGIFRLRRVSYTPVLNK